jgi:hypothetical protein
MSASHPSRPVLLSVLNTQSEWHPKLWMESEWHPKLWRPVAAERHPCRLIDRPPRCPVHVRSIPVQRFHSYRFFMWSGITFSVEVKFRFAQLYSMAHGRVYTETRWSELWTELRALNKRNRGAKTSNHHHHQDTIIVIKTSTYRLMPAFRWQQPIKLLK